MMGPQSHPAVKQVFGSRRIRSFLALSLLVLFMIFGAMTVAAAQVGVRGHVQVPEHKEVLISEEPSAPECERLGTCLSNEKRVFASLQVEGLSSNLSAPNTYTISGWFSLNWQADAYPDMRTSDLSLGCRSSGCHFSGWKNSWIDQHGDRTFWRAWFELEAQEADSLFSYPYDQHWVKILVQSSESEGNLFIDNIDINSFHVELTPSLAQGMNTNFVINYATVGNQVRVFSSVNIPNGGMNRMKYDNPDRSGVDRVVGGQSAGRVSPQQASADAMVTSEGMNHNETSVSFHLVRRTPAALLMIIIPMIVIILSTFMAYHWRESSPASRFGSSGLLTTVSLFYSSRVFRPDVDNLVFSDLWFIAVFVLLTINNLLLLWLFRFYKHRSEVKRANLPLPPAWRIENRLSWITAAIIGAVLLLLYIASLNLLKTPSIPIEFLAGNSNHDDVGASIVKVIEQHELLPSGGLIDIPSRQRP